MVTNRLEVDREDLMREATALRRRAEYRIPNQPETVIAGYRSDGSLSIYFGPDPCYHFDPEGRLRRAFAEGDLWRTQGGTLARMHRVRTEGSVELRRRDLSPDECDAFLGDLRDRLRALRDALRVESVQCLQELPAGARVRDQLIADLSRLTAEPLTLAPRIAGKR